MELLMTTDDATFDGRYYRLAHATYNPKPVQQPALRCGSAEAARS